MLNFAGGEVGRALQFLAVAGWLSLIFKKGNVIQAGKTLPFTSMCACLGSGPVVDRPHTPPIEGILFNAL